MIERTDEISPNSPREDDAGVGARAAPVLRDEPIRRAAGILRRYCTGRPGLELAQRIAQASSAELRAALGLLRKEDLRELAPGAPAASAPFPSIDETEPAAEEREAAREAPCPRCSRSSRDALLAMSCPWCGHAWAEEGAAQPPADRADVCTPSEGPGE